MTVVWVANRENPINDNSGILSIDNQGNLALFQKNQTLPVWSTNVSINGTRNSLAQLLDSGNLVLVQNDTQKAVLWQSFDYPTNTMLPFMKLGLSLKTGLNRFLTSWKSPNDPGIGNFSYMIDPSGFPQLYLFKGSEPLWRTGTWTGLRWSGVPEMTNTFIFNVSYVNNVDEVSITYGVKSFVITRMVTNETGIQQRFTWSKERQNWFGFWSAPKESCDFYGHCGPNAYCSPDQSDRFECMCFPGFEPKSQQEWDIRDGAGGCVRKGNFSAMCGNGEGFVKLTRAKAPDTSKARLDMSLGLKQCGEKCSRDCSCVAFGSAYYEGNGGNGCLTWHGDMVDARTYTAAGQDLFIRVDADELARYTRKGLLQKKGVLAAIIVSAVVLFLIVFVFSYWLVRKIRRERRRKSKSFYSFARSSSLFEDSINGKDIDESTRGSDLPFFELSLIASATNNFSVDNKLGQGGFGSVYKWIYVA
ncbi:S-locus glycoprotein [Corchorus olitorius]|uniref:S-locus glycoprotein n=1 Tax=Corchorus olitorius TaxID=93759 RepID=A0A1R3H3Q5_9ROSI|nr:S-locus glycoprotein [Corchorus olitorius]